MATSLPGAAAARDVVCNKKGCANYELSLLIAAMNYPLLMNSSFVVVSYLLLVITKKRRVRDFVI